MTLEFQGLSERPVCPVCETAVAPIGSFRLYMTRDKKGWTAFDICAQCLNDSAEQVADAFHDASRVSAK